MPAFVLTEERTPAEIVAWWDDLAEFAALKGARTSAKRRRAAQLRVERARLLGKAEAVGFEAYGTFEGTLSEFSPRLIRLIQAEGLDVADDDEMTVAVFRGMNTAPGD